MNNTKNTIVKLTVSLSIGLVFLAIWFYIVDVEKVFSLMRGLNVIFVITGVIFYMLAYFLRSLRWRLLLRTVTSLGVLKAYLTVMGGHFTNYLIPLRAGELMKCFFVKKMTGVRMSQSMPSVFLDKLYDTLGVVLILLLLPFVRINLSVYLNYLLVLIVFVTTAAVLLLVFVMLNQDRVISFFNRIFSVLPDSWQERIDEIMTYFIEGIVLFRKHKKMILPSILLSLVIILSDSLFFISMFWAFGVQIDYFFVLFGYTLIYLSFIIPHPPAQIGSNELLMVLIFAVGFGMNRELVSSIMVFAHLLTGVIMVVMGMISYSYAGVNLLNIIKPGDEQNE